MAQSLCSPFTPFTCLFPLALPAMSQFCGSDVGSVASMGDWSIRARRIAQKLEKSLGCSTNHQRNVRWHISTRMPSSWSCLACSPKKVYQLHQAGRRDMELPDLCAACRCTSLYFNFLEILVDARRNGDATARGQGFPTSSTAIDL